MRQSWVLSREGGWEAAVTSGDAEYGMMNMGVGFLRIEGPYIDIHNNKYFRVGLCVLHPDFSLYSGERRGKGLLRAM